MKQLPLHPLVQLFVSTLIPLIPLIFSQFNSFSRTNFASFLIHSPELPNQLVQTQAAESDLGKCGAVFSSFTH